MKRVAGRRRVAAFLMLALLVPAAAPASAAAASPVTSHDIAVRIDPATRRIEGHDVIALGSRRAAVLLLSERLQVDSLAVDGQRVDPKMATAGGMQRIPLPASQRIDIRWSGTLAALDRNADHLATLQANQPASGIDGTFLPAGSAWYPTAAGELERYRVAVDLPAGQIGLVPGRLLEERSDQGRYRARFEFDQPAEGITLVAGPYRIEERNLRTTAGSQVKLRTYFHPEIANVAGLASGYLDSVAGYIERYEKRIGAYPFAGFSVVSSPTPTGFGMPTMTYLGIEVLRLPFIRATSLGHEVLHNWWGNGVYPDFARGNWSEGLTTFMADYAYREQEGPQAASEARLAWLRDFAAMPRADDRPLQAFTSRTHGASQIIGYHKAAMLFFMLRDDIGEAVFERGLQRFWREQRFQRASWNDLRAAFENEAGRSLKGFFAQWLERSGAPDLRLVAARTERQGKAWRVSVTLQQGEAQGAAYALSVPLVIRTAQGDTTLRVPLSRRSETIVVDAPAEPQAVLLDPAMQLFRRLAPSEAPPILRQAMLAQDPQMMVLGKDDALRRAAAELAGKIFERTPHMVTSRSAAATLLVNGLHADIDAWLAREGLPPRPAAVGAGRGSAQVWTVAGGADKGGAQMTVVISAADAKALADLQRPLPHYGQQSFVVFDGAKMIERGVWPPRPQEWRL